MPIELATEDWPQRPSRPSGSLANANLPCLVLEAEMEGPPKPLGAVGAIDAAAAALPSPASGHAALLCPALLPVQLQKVACPC